MERTIKHPIFFVSGATGTGKSSLAVLLAQKLKSHHGYSEVMILNCDVMQFYKDLPIGTNKASLEEMGGVPHKFIGFLNCDDTWSTPPEATYLGGGPECRVGPQLSDATLHQPSGRFTVHTYTERVAEFIEDFFARNQHSAIIICGGTCYYLQSILFKNTLVDQEVDTVNSDTLSAVSDNDNSVPNGDATPESGDVIGSTTLSLWERLHAVDPAIALRYHPNDTRRITRLLELYRQQGVIPSAVYRSRKEELRYPPERTFIVWTWLERELLNAQLEKRVNGMVTQGLLGEIVQFRSRTSATDYMGVIREAIGFKEFADVPVEALLAAQDGRVDSAVAKVKSDTIHYARKQERWMCNRITELLDKVGRSLHPSHFVRVDLGGSAGKEAISDTLLASLVDRSAGMSLPGYLSLPLNSSGVAKKPVTQELCEACQKVVYGRGQMPVHIASKRHRGVLKRQRLEKEQFEKHGRVLPPRKKRD